MWMQGKGVVLRGRGSVNDRTVDFGWSRVSREDENWRRMRVPVDFLLARMRLCRRSEISQLFHEIVLTSRKRSVQGAT